MGSQEFVNGVAERNEWRSSLAIRPGEGGSWLVREAEEPGGCVAGAAAPAVFLSRADAPGTRLNSIALGVMMGGGG